MNANVKRLAIVVAIVITFIALALSSNAGAAGAKRSSPPAASPPPSWGYLGTPPIVLDQALAQSLDLRAPYYTRVMYNYCDLRNCTLQRREVVNEDGSRTFSWVPVWYGPFN
jgi:hypothetical protein